MNLTDQYNRQLNYLRVSITDHCNLRCIYCDPHGPFPKLPHNEILRYEEIIRILKIGIELGIKKIRITGGEPLLRRGVYDFLSSVKQLDGIDDVSLTTNAALLKDNVDKIKASGINRINVSLDTLSAGKYLKITGCNHFDRAWQGILAAHRAGFNPIKINVVPLRGINDDDLADLAGLSFDYPFHIRFIEYMPIGDTDIKNDPPLLTDEIKNKISRLGEIVPIKNGRNDGPARRYKFEGALGEIGFISPISRHFCSTCNRLRLTADGHLKPCLLSENQTDLKTQLRSGCSDQELADTIIQVVQKKHPKHHITSSSSEPVSGQMSSIGG